MTILRLERFVPYRLNRAAAAVSEQLKSVSGAAALEPQIWPCHSKS